MSSHEAYRLALQTIPHRIVKVSEGYSTYPQNPVTEHAVEDVRGRDVPMGMQVHGPIMLRSSLSFGEARRQGDWKWTIRPCHRGELDSHVLRIVGGPPACLPIRLGHQSGNGGRCLRPSISVRRLLSEKNLGEARRQKSQGGREIVYRHE